MRRVRMKGKNIEEAVGLALQVLQAKKEDVEINIVSPGGGGVLGILGGEEAEVEVSLKMGIGEQAKSVLQEILDKMGFMSIVALVGEEEDRIALEIKGEDMGRIIGKEGATLKALETIISAALSKNYGKKIWLALDAQGYKKRKAEKIERIAKEAAEKAIKGGEEVVLPPMTSGDRRIVHMALQENEKVSTISRGEAGERRVVIVPKKNE